MGRGISFSGFPQFQQTSDGFMAPPPVVEYLATRRNLYRRCISPIVHFPVTGLHRVYALSSAKSGTDPNADDHSNYFLINIKFAFHHIDFI
jgi:hypothetical protein